MSELLQTGAERLEAARARFKILFPSVVVFTTDAWDVGLDPNVLDTVFAKKEDDPAHVLWKEIKNREEELENVFGICQVLLEGLFSFKDLTDDAIPRTDALLVITRAIEKAINARMSFWGEAFDRLFPSVNRLVEARSLESKKGLSTLQYFYNKMSSSLQFGWNLMSYQDMIISQELAAAAKALEAFEVVINEHETERLAPRGSSLEQLAGKANLKVILHKLSKEKEERGERLGILLRAAGRPRRLPLWDT